jgi:hypothetical protein
MTLQFVSVPKFIKRKPDVDSEFSYFTSSLIMASKKSSRKASGPGHRSTLSLQKTQIVINVYDLLPVCHS